MKFTSIKSFPFILPLLACTSISAQSIPYISNNRTIMVTNNCIYPLWPAVFSSNGTGPYTTGFQLSAGVSKALWVSSDWDGRLWGRTNCTFDSITKLGSCITGDCGGRLECQATGETPTTLAEFTITGHEDLTYYDISLVDGWSVDMKISVEGDSTGEKSPSCVAEPEAEPEKGGGWCPFDLLMFPPDTGSKAFWYPNDGIKRGWSPCLSACTKWMDDKDCCAGEYDDPLKCKPNLYSKRAKAVCPDAYSFAYDDSTSTFTVPTGPSFEVTFCPGGESTNIMKTTNGASSAAGRKTAGNLWVLGLVIGMWMMF
ncbi:hypothetical protein RUND412_002224 [Rhizina undulata]